MKSRKIVNYFQIKLLLLLSIILISNLIYSQSSISSKIENGFISYYNDIKSGTLEIKRDFKEMYKEDTIKNLIRIKFYRKTNSFSDLQIDIDIKSNDGDKRISFDGEYFYFASDFSKIINIYSTDEIELIKDNVRYYLMYLPFIDPKSYFDQIKNSGSFNEDTDFYIYTSDICKIYFSKKDYSIKRIIEIGKVHRKTQYIDIVIQSQSFNNDLGKNWLYNDNPIPDDYFIVNNTCKQDIRNELCSGIPAPDINFKSMDGNTISLDSLKGKIVILDFWYMSCKPCMKVISVLENLKKKYKDDLIIIGVNSIDPPSKQLTEFIQDQKLDKIQLLDTSMVLRRKYKVSAFPTFYLINKRGIISFTNVGYNEDLKSVLKENIDKLLEKN